MSFPIVSIIGCGWLGLSLAKVLINEGYVVKGSTTTLEKIPVLQKAGIFVCRLKVDHEITGDRIEDLFDAEVVVITLPFRRNDADPGEYQKHIAALTAQCVRSKKVQTVIFTSSTSIYPDVVGEAREDVDLSAGSARSAVLQSIENALLQHTAFSAVIVRLAGLYGGTRRIGSFLSGKTELSDGESRVNLIHQDDAVGIIQSIIKQRDDLAGQIFNGCSDRHPTRKELYTAAALKMNVSPPIFAGSHHTKTKVVVNEKVKNVLGYTFLHPDPMDDV